MRNGKIGGIFVRTDNPAYLERQSNPVAEVLDLDTLNVAELKTEYRQRQRNFSTAPIDPTGRSLRFFPGGFSIWSGFPGSGKTSLLSQLSCHLMHCGHSVFMCSLEEKPKAVFMRHAITALGTDNPSDDGLQWCADMWSEKLRIWNYAVSPETSSHQKILAAARFLAREQGVRHAMIDSMMCLDIVSNDYEAQRLFALALVATCELANIHLHLVAHPKKPIQAGAKPELSDVAGSSDLSRRADNVLFVKRSDNESVVASGLSRPMRVSVLKQRHGSGFIGDIEGHFNHGLRQFVPDAFRINPIEYLPAMAYERRIDPEPLEAA